MEKENTLHKKGNGGSASEINTTIGWGRKGKKAANPVGEGDVGGPKRQAINQN